MLHIANGDPAMTLKHYAEQIAKTGFVLENKIAQQLKAARWTVISNRYYVDDTEESVREIDLVAYKATRVQHFDVITTLLISCKKNEGNAWALLARPVDLRNPNYDWEPLHTWTNDKALSFQRALPKYAFNYHSALPKGAARETHRQPEVEVFAFQEMNKTSGAPQNDRSIFQSITSLMKAQAYEVTALPQRKTTPAAYQFNLLSVVDTEMVRLMFEGGAVKPSHIEREDYIARYIIKRRETFSRIRFLHADLFENSISEYDALHSANCKWFDDDCNGFYLDAVRKSDKRDVFREEFQRAVGYEIRWCLMRHKLPYKEVEPKTIGLYWRDEQKTLVVDGPFGDIGESILDQDAEIRATVAAALQRIYRYQGPFALQNDDIPF